MHKSTLGASTLFNRLEFLQPLEVLPWLLPDLSFVELLDFAILHFNSEIVHRASNHLCLGLHKLLEPQKSILRRATQKVKLQSKISRTKTLAYVFAKAKVTTTLLVNEEKQLVS